MNRKVFSALVALAALALAPPAAAQPPQPSVEIHAEYFRPSFDSTVRFDAAELALRGIAFDVEDELGVEDTTGAVRAELLLRPGPRGGLTLDYAAFERSGTVALARDLQLPAPLPDVRLEALLDSTIESRWAALGWRYALVARPAGAFGLTLSVAWVELSAATAGMASLGDGPSFTIAEAGQIDGPVPMLGLFGERWLGDRYRISGHGRYLEIEDLDGWSGSAIDYGLRFEWFLLDRVALAAGWGGTDIEADSEDTDELLRAETAYQGFRAGLTFAF